ncbi:MAG: restriction endonuclease subunit S [Staphylococcus sp.]|nr:restriction endonuclease subunit S [Staphylococcus sp.]
MNKIKLINLTIDNKGHYGLGASSSPFDKDFPLYLRITDIDDNSYVSYLPTCVDPKQYPDYNNHLLKNNDIVFARTGNSTGRNYFYDGKFKNVVFAGFLIKYSLDPKKVNPKYVSYYCQSQEYKSTIDALSNGSTRKNLNANQFGRIEIPLYSIETQQHIVDTIGSIDDLIEHKLLLLDKLEQLEKNLYLKECLNKDKFSLLDRLQFIKGKKPKNFTDNGIDYLTIDALENGNLTYTNDEKLVYCKTNDILMVMDGASSGKVYIGYNGVVGSTLAKIKTNINPYYLYIYLKNNYKNIREHNIGSAIPHTNKDIIYTLKISNNTISNEIYNFLLNTRINLNIEIIHLKSLKTSYLKKFFG